MSNINLNYKMVTDIKNNFFTNNRFIAAESLPAEGDFIKGDLIVNIGENANDEAMWLCVESGNPGVWEVVGAGTGGNTSGGGSYKIVTLKSRVVVNEALSEVNIGVSGFNKATDTLMVFNNTRFMVEGIDYEINADSTKILAMNGNIWNEELANDFVFDFVVFKMMNVNENGDVIVSSGNEIVKLKNTVIVNQAVNEVEIGIDGFNEGDDLTVYRNSVYMIEGIDYEIQGNKIVSLKGTWNTEGGSDYKFTFEVLKTVAKVNPDAVIGMEHLTEDVKEAIEAAGNIDLSGYATKTDVGDKTQLLTAEQGDLVGAINELYEDDVEIRYSITTVDWRVDDVSGYMGLSGIDTDDNGNTILTNLQTNDKTSLIAAINEVFQSGNNVKQQLVDTLIAKGVNVSTSSSWDEILEYVGMMIYKGPIFEGSGTIINGSEMINSRYGFGAHNINDQYIYVMGGCNSSYLNTTEKYDIKANTWERVADMPVSLGYFASSPVGTNIYCFCGINGSGINSAVYQYDSLLDTWTTKSTTLNLGVYLDSVNYKDNIYIFGGCSGLETNSSTSIYSTLYLYNPITDTKTSKASSTYNSSGHTMAVVGNLIYSFDGNTNNNSYFKSYDPTTNSWTMLSLSLSYYRYSAGVVDDKVYLIGGSPMNSSSYSAYNYIYLFDPNTVKCEKLSISLSTARRDLEVTTVGNRIYCLGGCVRANYSTYTPYNVVEIYTV